MPRKFDFISPGIQLTEIDQSTVPAQTVGDGPLLIGRSIRGPAMQPIRISSFDDFVSVFGDPVYGQQALDSDVWRNGNTDAPTYAAIAAEAWLAANESPINFIRLLGEQSPNAVTAGQAGWDTARSASTAFSASGGAVGLFVAPSSSIAQENATGSLGAIFYINSGFIELSGTIADGSGSISSGSNVMMDSLSAQNAATFKAIVKNDAGAILETVAFDFTPGSKNYIRSVFNTSPYAVETQTQATPKTYWLGETYEEEVQRVIGTSATAGQQLGITLQLASGSTGAVPGGNRPNLTGYQKHKFASIASQTGWFINRDPSETPTEYSPEGMEKLFRIVALQAGSSFQNEYYCSIEDLKLGTEINKNSTFTLSVRRWSNNALVEQYSKLVLNPVSDDYILKRIGDMRMVWDATDLKFNLVGKYNNLSDYIRIEMADALKNDQAPQDPYALPFGYYGPQKFLNFTLSGSNSRPVDPTNYASNLNHAMVVGSGNMPGNPAVNRTTQGQGGFAVVGPADGEANQRIVTFKFPELRLSTVLSNGVQNANYRTSAMLGVNQQLSSSNLLDQGYRDLLRAMPSGWSAFANSGVAALSTETSFIFTMDDVVWDELENRTYFASGSRAGNSSLTATSGSQSMLDKNIKQYIAPMFGGFDGLDITKLEPFNNTDIGTADSTSYTYYTLNKTLDMASDAETVEMDLLLMPGINKVELTNKMISVCDERQDSLAIIDLESAFTPVGEATPANIGVGSTTAVISSARSRNFNSSYAAAYHPWVRVRAKGQSIIADCPPSVAACGAIARSQALSAPWFAPAGFNRGGIGQLGGSAGPNVTSLTETLNKANRDDLYQIDINPIARLQGEFVIFGQKTLQQTPSALDRINVRRMMIDLKKQIGRIANTILFDQNIQVTWNKFKNKSERVLSRIKAGGGITEYKIILDSSTTTPSLQDRNILYAKIYIKPAKAIEFIAVDFIITRSGVQF